MCKRLLVGVAHFLPQGVDTMVCHTKQKEKEIEETNKQAKNEFYILKIGHKKMLNCHHSGKNHITL